MYLSSSSLLSFASLYDGGNFVVTRYICEVIYCFVSLGFLAYNWICFCRAFAGVSKYCAKNHLSTAEDWQNRSIFTLEYFIAVVIFNLGLNFRRRRAYSFFLSGKQSYCWTELLHILRMVRATILIQIYWLGGGEIKKNSLLRLRSTG